MMSDGLPAFDIARNGAFVRDLAPHLRVHHCLEEGWLFPLLTGRLPGHGETTVNLLRLKQEHMEDCDAASDLGDHIRHVLEDAGDVQAERLAYQTRALFRSLRRHVAFEVEVIFPLAERLLTADDLLCLSHAYDRSEVADAAYLLRH
ncbi:hypothetical protein ASG43_05070 [Aureimonas sp. Leaf454]|nr:hypothetical protein ASG43_05070 [Aureimonas sp. Leaf454]